MPKSREDTPTRIWSPTEKVITWLGPAESEDGIRTYRIAAEPVALPNPLRLPVRQKGTLAKSLMETPAILAGRRRKLMSFAGGMSTVANPSLGVLPDADSDQAKEVPPP